MRKKFGNNPLLATIKIALKQIILPLLAISCINSWASVPLRSTHALVVDDSTGEVLLEKDSGVSVPIASLTKLMTAMVILDAKQSPTELIRIIKTDLTTPARTRFGVPAGAVFPRKSLVELALMSSDNRAAMALARNYPGGFDEFKVAMNRKIRSLQLNSTSIEEPTGLSSNNRSSAIDVAKILRAASTYPEIAQFTAQSSSVIQTRGRLREYHNTNKLVGAAGWNILLSKTGFTTPAGRCIAMRILTAAGRTVSVVLLGAWSKNQRTHDALNLHSWLANEGNALINSANSASRILSSSSTTRTVTTTYDESKKPYSAASLADGWSLKMDLGVAR